MSQLQQFIVNIGIDKKLFEKTEKLLMGEAPDKEIVALAAEYGFSITAEELELSRKPYNAGLHRGYFEVSEESLEAVVGGVTLPKENRHNPAICSQYNKTHDYCLGFLGMFWCEHYRSDSIGLRDNTNREILQKKCVMGYFDYEDEVYRQ